MSSVEDRIISYLMNNMDDIQSYINKTEAPDDFLFDVVVRRIEEDTGCNYIDILEYLDKKTFNKLFGLYKGMEQ